MWSDFGPLDGVVVSIGCNSLRLVKEAVLLRFDGVEGLLESLAETWTAREAWSRELRRVLGSSSSPSGRVYRGMSNPQSTIAV